LDLDPNLNSRDFFMSMRRDSMGRADMPEISDSYLAYTAGALVLLTIFYNLIFSFFIKPSIDGYQKPILIDRVPLSDPDSSFQISDGTAKPPIFVPLPTNVTSNNTDHGPTFRA
jgi:hypothetical protein